MFVIVPFAVEGGLGEKNEIGRLWQRKVKAGKKNILYIFWIIHV